MDVRCSAVQTATDTLSEAERDWVLGYSAAKGYDASLVEELKHYPANEDIVALVTSHPALNSNRLCLVHDALCACLADGELTDGEWKTVLRMAAKLDVAEDQVIAIRDAIAAETNAREARIKLIYPNQIPFRSTAHPSSAPRLWSRASVSSMSSTVNMTRR